MFILRFDMRAPAFGAASVSDLYAAALDMAEWAEGRGCVAAVVSEHHASPDGYLPAPLILTSALLARTKALPIQVAALLLPLYEPVRLAEEMAVLDILGRGRVSYVFGMGYRDEEFAMFGVARRGRGRRAEETIEFLRRAWTGEPFDYQGRRVCVTPTPATAGGPVLMMGGSTPAAARRAARCGLGLYAQSSDAELETVYRAECAALGRAAGVCVIPPAGLVTSAFVAEDVEDAWREMGPYLLHDARMYTDWLGRGAAAVRTAARSVEELRAENGAYRIFSVDEAVEYARTTGVLVVQPLCGGLPPALAWRSLRLIGDHVVPALQ